MTQPVQPPLFPQTGDPTAPKQPPAPSFSNTDPNAFGSSIDKLAQLATGNNHINTHPGLMNALVQANATPQQAQEIDQFIAGVKAQNMYQLAVQQGGKVNFSTAERNAMDAMNFDYSKVDATASSNQQAVIDNLHGKGLKPTLNPDGSLATDANGNVLVSKSTTLNQPQSHANGFFDKGVLHGIGRIFNDATHNPVTNAIGGAYNVVSDTVGSVYTDVSNVASNLHLTAPGQINTSSLPSQQGDRNAQRDEQMRILGYNPNSIWSDLAFAYHGYAKTDITPALKAWDDSAGPGKFNGQTSDQILPTALEYLKDPKGYQEKIIGDTTLTPEQVGQKIALLNDPDFVNFTKRLQADQSTFGHAAMQSIGVDPVKDPHAYNIGAATTDLIASFYIDPTMLLGKSVNAVRKLPIAIDSLNDSERAAALLDPEKAVGSMARQRVINGWQSMIDSTNDIRAAFEAGDKPAVAAAYASIKAKTPELEPLIGDFLGTSQAHWRTTAEGVTGLSDLLHVNATGEPITNLAEAAKFITQRGGLIRLQGAKAAVETSYMPGAVSNYGYRALKANVAAHLAEKDAIRTAAQSADYLAARNAGTLGATDKAISDAAFERADPATVTHTIDMSKIRDFLPTPIDGVDMKSGLVVAAPDAQFIGQHVDTVKDALAQVKAAQQAALKSVTKNADGEEFIAPEALSAKAAAGANLRAAEAGLASAIRAAADRAPKTGDWADTLLPAEQGQVAFNVRKYGTAVAPENPGIVKQIGGWASPTAIAARARLATARFSTLLPRNTNFDLTDPGTADKVYKYARFYLGKGEAANLAASFANGDLGARKAIVQGLWDQVGHAAGLPRTSLGKELMDSAKTEQQAYTHAGPGWVIDGNPVAQHDGQVTKSLMLPSFKDVHHAAAKLGLYESTFGRLGTSGPLDSLFNLFRFGILAAPKTAYRNIIEPYAKAALDGQFGDVIRARALTYSSSDELAQLGKKLGVDGVTGEIPESAVQTARQHFEEMAQNGTGHQKAVAQHTLNRIEKGDLSAMAGFQRTRLGSSLADNFSRLSAYYHHALLTTMPEEEFKHADELAHVLPQMAHNFGEQIVANRFDPYGAQQVRDITESGLAPGKIEYNLAAGDHPLLRGHVGSSGGGAGTKYRRVGYDLESTDKSVGKARYISALAQRTSGSPEVAKAAMAAIRDPEGDLQPVIDALDARVGPRLTAYGKYFRPDESKPEAIKALTPDEVTLGKRQWAQDVVNDYKYLLTSENGQINTKIADYITEHGTAPDSNWMDTNVKGGQLPRSVLAPQYEAQPVGGVQNLANTLNDLTGRAFNQMVEGPIKRQSTMPFLASHYLKARAEQDVAGTLDTVMSHGIEESAARELLMGQAMRQAYIRTEQMIDDPGLKTQFDIVARNLFMFPRAMQAFVRRWGGSLQRDPFKARRMMLALEATEHSGMVYRDENGELTFTYPGSQVMRDAMVGISHIPGFGGLAKFPTGMDMTGKVLLAAPGFDQPFRFSLSPMVNIPMRAVFAQFPEHADIWNEIDTVLNGQLGSGRGPLQQVEPSVIQKFFSAANTDEKNSAFASAMVGAMAHLDAAGYTPDPSAPPNVQDAYRNQLKAQVRNQLLLRFAFGLIAPAPPSSLEENIDQSAAKAGGSGTGSDYSFNMVGIKNLSAEYKSILNSTNGDVARATQIFTYLHPEGLAYTVPTTQAGTSKAQLPATTESLKWMESNLPFLNQYKSVAAYFLPKPQGDFDYNAYQAQMAMGLRQKKSVSEFYQSIQESKGLAEYYKAYDQYTQMHTEAVAAGDPQQAKVLAGAFQDWKRDFLGRNPFVAAKFAGTSANKVSAQQQVQDLNDMVSKGQVPDGLAPRLSEMLDTWKQYSDWRAATTGSGAIDSATRQAALDFVDQKMSAIANTDPRLANIYNAVFRTADSSLTKLG